MTENKPNYNDNQGNYSNTYGQPQYPANYSYRSTNDLYEEDSSGTGSFIAGAIIGGLIGAATALFLAPKSGREMREDLSSQATHLKEKSIELTETAKDKVGEYSSTAKEKAEELSSTAKDKIEELSTAAKDYTSDFTESAKEKAEAFTSAAKEKTEAFTSAAKEKTEEFTSAAKEKTSDLQDSVQEHSEELVDKVKTAAGKSNIPMDDGTASTKGEESTDFKSTKENNVKSGDLSKVKDNAEDHNAKANKSVDDTSKNTDHNKSNDHNKKDDKNNKSNNNQNHNKK